MVLMDGTDGPRRRLCGLLCVLVIFGALARCQEGPATRPLTQPAGPATLPSTVLVIDLGQKITMRLALIPSGKFVMGSPAGEKGRRDDEMQHPVTISRPFYMGVYEVTRGQFAAFVADTGYRTDAEKKGYCISDGRGQKLRGACWRNPGFKQTDEHPAACISHRDAEAFCKWLSKKTGRGVSLPTEAQWEYACRAGTKTAYVWGNDPAKGKRWCNEADLDYRARTPSHWDCFNWRDGYVHTSPVGKFRPNAFGLYDMVGNVWEHCSDWYDDGYYARSKAVDPMGPKRSDWRAWVVRGGCWYAGIQLSRSASRSSSTPRLPPYRGEGFRVVVNSPRKSRPLN